MSTSGELVARASSAFTERFGAQPTFLGRAPGRVELLGNHTDYNGGLVMAVAIDRFTIAAGRPSAGQQCRVHAVNFQGSDSFDLDHIERGESGDWSNYVKGVVWAIQDAEGPRLSSGFDLAILGDVPLGAGLSSSASLEAAVAFFLLRAGLIQGRSNIFSKNDLTDPSRMALAKILRRSENAFVGVASGLLDQFSSLFGREHHALYLDCQTLEYARLPLGDPGPAIIVCDSKTSRRLADGMYNRRRAECETVVTYFQAAKGPDRVTSLRDVDLDELARHWDKLDPVGRRRARHVLTENDRVRRGAAALKRGDLAEFGQLVSASHASSRDDFENSSEALDTLIEAAESAPGFLGGKLSGAGWAGCTVNLVNADQAESFAEMVRATFARRLGVTPDIHICHAADGAAGRELP
jgi:galactokinase